MSTTTTVPPVVDAPGTPDPRPVARVPRHVAPGPLSSLLCPLGEPWEVTLRLHPGSLVPPPGWQPLDEVVAQLREAHAAAVADGADARAAAADLVPWTAGLPAVALVLPAVLLDVLPVVRLPRDRSLLLVHHHADGWLDGVALPPSTSGLRRPRPEHVAALVHDVAAPAVALGAGALPITTRAAWGGVVDTLTNAVLAAARGGAGVDQVVAWDRLQRVVDALAERVPLAARPRQFPVAWSQGPSLFPVRGTCCLHYRNHEQPDRDGEGYCSTCPLRTDRSRQERIAAYLERCHADAGTSA